jgi:Flp pilus assembly protein TadB
MSMGLATLVLRDVHVPPSPSWWPLAPGWWLVLGAVLLLVVGISAWRLRRRRRQLAWQRWFDEAGTAQSPAEQVAAMSERLRRAARRLDPSADRLEGEDWLRFLDGKRGHAFSQGPGRLLLDGGYRRDVSSSDLAAASAVARARFLALMAGER